MGDFETVAKIVLRQKDVLVTLLIGMLVLAPGAAAIAHRRGWSRARIVYAALAGVGLAFGPATTLARGYFLIRWHRTCNLGITFSISSPEAMLNCLLFVPAAFFGVLAVQRLVPVVVFVAIGSSLIEAIQLITGLGTCEANDVLRDTAGAVAAALVAVGILSLSAASRRGSHTGSSAGHVDSASQPVLENDPAETG